MYYLAIAASEKYVAKTGPKKGQTLENEPYKQVQNGPQTFEQAVDRLTSLVGTSKAGTKIKLVITVPGMPAKSDSKAELLAKIAELTAQINKAA